MSQATTADGVWEDVHLIERRSPNLQRFLLDRLEPGTLRQIAEIHGHTFRGGDGRLIGEEWTCTECRETYPEWWCRTLRLLAQPLAADPDFQPEWRL